MRFKFVLVLTLFSFSLVSRAQVVISDIGGTSDSSAILELKSHTRGFLPPRLTSDQMMNIPNPKEGLIVFCTTDNKYYLFLPDENCWKEFLYDSVNIARPSEFSFGTNSNCANFSGNGTYTAGIPVTSSNNVSFDVTVTKPGAYSVSTNFVNGYSFSGSGVFDSAGTDRISLAATGKPLFSGNDQFTVTSANTVGSCLYTIDVSAGLATQTIIIGSGNGTDVNYPFPLESMDSRTQMLYLVNELLSAGANPGVISSIGFKFFSPINESISGFRIKMKNTDLMTLCEQWDTDLTTVYEGTFTFTYPTNCSNDCWQMINLQTPFTWNGKNLLVEICFDKPDKKYETKVASTVAPYMTQHYAFNGISSSGCDNTITNVKYYRPDLRLYCLPPTQSSYSIGQAEFCTNTLINGLYVEHVSLNESNTVSIKADVTTPGAYFLTTDTVNGIFFCGSGTFTSTGVQIVTLLGSGVPISVDTVTFTIQSPYCNGNCYFSIISTPFFCGMPFTDKRNGKIYNTVDIGCQCWMKENLNLRLDIGGNPFFIRCYNNKDSNCNRYGGLYEWARIMNNDFTEGSQGICPSGSYIPKYTDWIFLRDQLGGETVAGGKMKETGTIHWAIPNSGATNESGFTAFGSGMMTESGYSQNIKTKAVFWSSSEDQGWSANFIELNYEDAALMSSPGFKNDYLSVRCIINDATQYSIGSGGNCWNSVVSGIYLAGHQLSASNTVTLIATVLTPGKYNIYTDTINGYYFSSMGCFASAGTQTITLVAQGTPFHAQADYFTVSTTNSNGSCTFLINVTNDTFNCGNMFTDSRDGRQYSTVQIGSQCWMKENLNVGMQILGNQDPSNNGVIEKYCFDDNVVNCTSYGGLYTWHEMMQYSQTERTQGICPNGWYLPSNQDWNTLITYLGGINAAGGKMKEIGFVHWQNPNTGANNLSGFSGLPGGKLDGVSGSYYYVGYRGCFWPSSRYDITSSGNKGYALYHDSEMLDFYWESYFSGLSVRCIRETPSTIFIGTGDNCINTTVTGSYLAGLSLTMSNTVTIEVNVTSLGSFTLSTDTVNGYYFKGSGVFLQTGVQTVTLFGNGTPVNVQTDQFTVTSPGTSGSCTFNISVASCNLFCGCPLTDIRDGKKYNTVQIGSQCWMKENLDIGMAIPLSQQSTNNGIIEKHCYNDIENNCTNFGGLYQWDELMQYHYSEPSRGICPYGWHVPMVAEFEHLINSNGGTNEAGTSLKESGTTHFKEGNYATNSSGFTALPGGQYCTVVPVLMNDIVTPDYSYLYHNSHYWSSTREIYSTKDIYMCSNATFAKILNSSPIRGKSVRCIKDTPAVFSFGTSGSCQGVELQEPIYTGHPLHKYNTISFSVDVAIPGIFSISTNLTNGYFFSGQGVFTETGTQVVFLTGSGTPSVTQIDQFVAIGANSCGSCAFTVAVQDFLCPESIIDPRDGKIYETILVGSQCWLKENMNIGTLILHNQSQSNNSLIEKYCYNNLESNCDVYGGLYQWDEAMQYEFGEGVQGICPTNDWHMPSEKDWYILEAFLGGDSVAGGVIKQSGITYWLSPNTGPTNRSGFDAKGSGNRISSGFGMINYRSYFWSSYSISPFYETASSRFVSFNDMFIEHPASTKTNGYSVRCIKKQ